MRVQVARWKAAGRQNRCSGGAVCVHVLRDYSRRRIPPFSSSSHRRLIRGERNHERYRRGTDRHRRWLQWKVV